MAGAIERRWVVAALVGIRVLVLALVIRDLLVYPVGDGDFYRFVQIVGSHGMPYRDYPVEYMPLELAAIFAVAQGGVVATGIVVAVSSFVMELGIAGAIALGWGRRRANQYLLFGLPLLTVMYRRLDFLVVLLAVLGFALSRKERPRVGGVLIGLSVLAKVWPLFLVPVLLIERRRTALTWALATTAIGGVAWLAYAGIGGVREVATFRGATGWEAESTIGLLVWIAGGSLFMQRGATRVGRMPTGAGAALMASSVALAVVIWRRARTYSGDLLGAPALGALCALLALTPLFSLQYMAWVVPWVAIAWDDARAHTPALLALGAVCVTGLLLPTYNHVPAALDQILLLWRNSMVAGVVAWWLLPARSARFPQQV